MLQHLWMVLSGVRLPYIALSFVLVKFGGHGPRYGFLWSRLWVSLWHACMRRHLLRLPSLHQPPVFLTILRVHVSGILMVSFPV